MRLVGTVSTDLRGLRRFREDIKPFAKTREVATLFNKWAADYRTFLKARYEKFSKGGGNWRRLRPETIRRKRRRGGKRFILRDTDVLYRALNRRFTPAAGAFQRRVGFGVEVGFSDTFRHPHSRSGVTVGAIASYHNAGGGRLPRRQIMVLPDQRTKQLFVIEAQNTLGKLLIGLMKSNRRGGSGRSRR